MVLSIRRRRDRARCRRARVWLNGRDVTRRCWKVDGRRRRVWLYREDGAGRLYQMMTAAGQWAVASEERRGRVRIRVARPT